MKKDKTLNLKTAFMTIVLAVFIVIVILFSDNTLAANKKKNSGIVWDNTTINWIDGKEATQKSKDKPVSDGIVWKNKLSKKAEKTVKNPSAPTLAQLLDPSQVLDNGRVIITYEDYRRLPSVFCSAKGVHIPSKSNIVVRSGGREASTTDQGVEVAYLTEDDFIKNVSPTVFRNLDEWTDWGATKTTKYEDTTSETLASFTMTALKDATPAEAWVLAEFDNNIPGKTAKLTETTEEYTGDVSNTTLSADELTISNFIDNVRSIAKYAKSNKFEYGSMKDIPINDDYVTKKISNTDLVRWALYTIGYDLDTNNIEQFCKNNNWKKITKVENLHAGDILFFEGSSDADTIKIKAGNNKVYDLGSTDKIRLTGEYKDYKNQPIKFDLTNSKFKYAYRIPEIKGLRSTVATEQNARTEEVDGETLYLVGDPGEERYVKKVGKKYYYVNVSDGYAPTTYVQHAWWKVKTVGKTNTIGKETDLANEAYDFEKYVKEVTGIDDVTKLPRNEDGTFKINYKVSMEPQDTKKILTRFNSETNKYIVGPFKVNYLRSVTKQGDRPKVSFSGISDCILVGVDKDGNELVDSEGNSVLQLGKNYKFVYSHTDDEKTNYGHDNKRNKLDTDADYPYPSSGEEFYIQIDYLDNLVGIKNFKFDFQYLTAGGKYELYEGQYLKIHWTQGTEFEEMLVPASSTASIENKNVAIAVSDRKKETNGNGEGDFEKVSEKIDFKEDEIQAGEYSDDSGFLNVIKNQVYCRNDQIVISGSIIGIGEHQGDSWTISDIDGTELAEDPVINGNQFTIHCKRDFSKPKVDKKDTIVITAYVTSCVHDKEDGSKLHIDEVQTVHGEIDLSYKNELLGDTCHITIKETKNNEIIKVNDDQISVGGLIENARGEVTFRPEMNHSETDVSKLKLEWDVKDGESLKVVNRDTGKFRIVDTGECLISCSTDIEEKVYKVDIPNFYLNKYTANIGEKVEFYNAKGYMSVGHLFAGRSEVNLVSAQIMEEEGKIMICGTNSLNSLKQNLNADLTISGIINCRDEKEDRNISVSVVVNGSNSSGGSSSSGGSGGSGGSSNSGGSGGSGSSATLNSIPESTATKKVRYCYYLIGTSMGAFDAQDQINAVGSHEVKNIDAENGLGSSSSGEPVELEMLTTDIDLRTSISGVVWIDHDEDKDAKSSGTLGIYDHNEGALDRPAAKNSVEVMVWKVLYEKNSGKEIERTKAIGWNLDGKDKDGKDKYKEIDFMNSRIFINGEGKYSIDKIQIPSIEGLDTKKYTVSYDVEFIYDGQTYEATELLKATEKDTIKEKVAEFQKTAKETAGAEKDYTKYVDSSYIVENALEREQFDSYFTEVAGKEAIDDNGNTNGQASGGTDGAYYLQKDEKTDRTAKRTELQYTSTLSDVGTEGNRMRISNVVTTNDEGYVLDQYRFAARTSEARLRYPYENQYHVKEDYYDNLQFQKKDYKPIDEYFEQINLGLLERYNSDISVLKDVYSAKVVVNEQETNYTFNSLEKLTNDALTAEVDAYRTQTYTIGLYNSDYYYRSSVYSSEDSAVEKDIAKKIIAATKENTELRLFVTYKIAITNKSELTDVSINEFKDYYDKTFTLVNDTPTVASILDNNGDRHDKVVAETPFFRKLKAYDDSPEDKKTDLYRWNKAEDLAASGIDKYYTDDGKEELAIGNVEFAYKNENNEEVYADSNKNYKLSVTSSLSALNKDSNGFNSKMSLEPGETMEVFVTYEVDQEGYIQATKQGVTDENGKSQERLNLLEQKSNIAEISKYSTAYTKEAVERHKTTSYKEGNISGRIDKASAPDNINMEKIGDANFIEDDTNFAPVLTVELKSNTPRTLNGKVWEDSREDYKEANGKYDETVEKGIKDIDVTLVEKIRIGKEDIAKYGGNLELLDYEFEFVWPDNAFGDKVPYTSRGKTSDDGDYQFQNFTAGNYVVRFEYGNSTETLKYNGQDYKNTAYQTGMTNTDKEIGTSNVPGNATLNNEWHDLSNNENAKALQETRYSDARDYEPRRMKVIAYSRTITNKNAEVLAAYIDDADTNLTDNYKGKLKENEQELINNTAMVANTAKFNVEIEKQDSIAYKTVETTDGIQGHDSYEISNIDFGLVRRPETRINIKKEIASIGLYKNDGTEPILFVKMDDNGDIIKDDKNGINIDKITEIRKEDLGDGQGFKYIGMESSLLKGLKVQLNYKVTVENNSENDYVGKNLARIKNIQELYDTVIEYETGINSAGEITNKGTNEDGLSAFSTGRGIIYGEWLGLYYYTNIPPDISSNNEEIKNNYGYQYDDEIVKTTVDQLADYVDNDLSMDKEEITYENRYWAESTDADRAQKFSMMSYKGDINNIEDIIKDENFVDNKGRAYVTTNNNNIWLSYNENMIETPVSYKKTYDNKESVNTTDNSKIIIPHLEEVTLEDVYTSKQGVGNAVSTYNPVITQELEPGQNASINVVTSAQASEDIINSMNYDNLVEIVMYSNSVGRRDTETIPGNANMIAKYRPMYEAGYNYNYSESNRGYMTKEVKVDETADDLYRTVSETKQPITTERDAYAAKDTITFSEPTGLSIERETINKVISVILIGLLVTAVAIIIATVLIVIKKTKYDDGHLVKTDNKN